MFNLNVDKIISDALIKILESKHFKKHIEDSVDDAMIQARQHLEDMVAVTIKSTVDQHRAQVIGQPKPLTEEEKEVLKS